MISLKFNLSRLFWFKQARFISILGIETSFDDTGAAVVNDKGEILGECVKSQGLIHQRHGGVQPPVAQELHQLNIKQTVEHALQNIEIKTIDAIAATVKPGLSLSLLVGTRFAQALCLKHNLPFIPIHHMEAHALTVRMKNEINFPFLVLLISGKHCLLAVAESVDTFLLLGQSLDDAPGEAFDKSARRLKLTNMDEYRNVPFGQAMENISESGNPLAFELPQILTKMRDCNFSFSGIKNSLRKIIINEEVLHEVPADGVIPTVNDVAASFQYSIARHLCQRVQRGIEYTNLKNLVNSNKKLVVSGGVACNKYIIKMIRHVASCYDYEVIVPERNLCTDNGIMIAWNGIERYRQNLGVYTPEKGSEIDIESRCAFGKDISHLVTKANLKCKWIKLPV